MIKEKFTTKVSTKPLRKKSDRFPFSKPVEFTNIPLSQVPSKSFKEDIAKSKFHSKKSSNKPTNKSTCTYAQASSANVCVMRCFGHQQFLFYFLLFFWLYRDFVFLFFFLFLLDNEEAHDNVVIWHVTQCDIIGLECGRRI